jgi:hypothetical protein
MNYWRKCCIFQKIDPVRLEQRITFYPYKKRTLEGLVTKLRDEIKIHATMRECHKNSFF